MKNKGLIAIGAISAILVGAGLYFWNKSKKESEASNEPAVEPKIDEPKKESTTVKPKDVTSSNTGVVTPKPPARPFETGFKAGDKIYLLGASSMAYSYPENKGQYVLGEIRKDIALDRPIGTFVSYAGTGFIKFKPVGWMAYDTATKKYSKAVSGAGKTAYINKSAASQKPY